MEENKKVSKYNECISQVDPKIIQKWTEEQIRLKNLLIEEEKLSFTLNPNDKSKPFLKRVACVDISTMKQDRSKALAALVVMDYLMKELKSLK